MTHDEDTHARQLREALIQEARDIGESEAHKWFSVLSADQRAMWNRNIAQYARSSIIPVFQDQRERFWMGSAGQWNDEALLNAFAAFIATWIQLDSATQPTATRLDSPDQLEKASANVRELRATLDDFMSPATRAQAGNEQAFGQIYNALAALTSLVGEHVTHVGQHGIPASDPPATTRDERDTPIEPDEQFDLARTRRLMKQLSSRAQGLARDSITRETLLAVLANVLLPYAPHDCHGDIANILIAVAGHHVQADDHGDRYYSAKTDLELTIGY